MRARWEKLGDIAHIYVGVPTNTRDREKMGVAANVITVRSLTDTGFDFRAIETFDFDDRDVEKYQVAVGDVVISARSTSLKSAVVPEGLGGCLINATLIGVRCKPLLIPRLLVAWLNG